MVACSILRYQCHKCIVVQILTFNLDMVLNYQYNGNFDYTNNGAPPIFKCVPILPPIEVKANIMLKEMNMFLKMFTVVLIQKIIQ